MLTLFTCPKSFAASAHVALIQRNALKSWCRLEPRPQIILRGDDEGVAEIAREFGVEHQPAIERNDFGTPLVSDIFAGAQKAARHEILCYINADMILGADFMRALHFVAAQKRPFLMVSQRWNLDTTSPIDFEAPNWSQSWPDWVKQNGVLDGFAAIDFFAFSTGLYDTIPCFAIGRPLWDNWMLYEARRCRVLLVDATPVVTLAHQNHDYAHVKSNGETGHSGPERERNFALLGALNRTFTIENATHRLAEGPRGLRLHSTFASKGWGRTITELAVVDPKFRPLGALATMLSQMRRRLMPR